MKIPWYCKNVGKLPWTSKWEGPAGTRIGVQLVKYMVKVDNSQGYHGQLSEDNKK